MVQLLSEVVPSDVDPLKNWTLPPGVPRAVLTAETFAVSVIDCPWKSVVSDDDTLVVDAWLTVTVLVWESGLAR